MKKRLAGRGFIYFLCVAFLLMMNGFPMGAEAKEKGIPIGEMVAKGEVKYEARENAWKEVESFHFPIFQGTKFKTEKQRLTDVHSWKRGALAAPGGSSCTARIWLTLAFS